MTQSVHVVATSNSLFHLPLIVRKSCITTHHSVVPLSRDSLLDFAELLRVNVVTLVLINHLEGNLKLSSSL